MIIKADHLSKIDVKIFTEIKVLFQILVLTFTK